ncbi:type II toxin-antitoxin system death-on-curing family toxin [Marinicella gelatinilytica]|uniref:type II toxin-antitoxin system death-on-curing family toxin n=1 Tax=Marinicella gelatinilytica TaxID=2996017 RepID=UPI002260CD9A|nr:type II toxin-antitoxin system death-on-curing family toxin [Marinicella gelatinilytica]MCX7545936.1 type II toxin-antitoxin system death-on-curing family toxin [Marinicella gelatinilytica]
MTQPKWLKQSVIETLHDMQIAEHGGLAGVRDKGLLSSALARPKNMFEYESASIYQLAAAYAYSLVKNHPFADGNKRTALLAAYTFLHINNVTLTAPEAETTAMVIALAAGDMDEKGFADWLQQNSETAPD